jgi:hypothetical protein
MARFSLLHEIQSHNWSSLHLRFINILNLHDKIWYASISDAFTFFFNKGRFIA